MSDSGSRLIGAAREALILAKDAEIARLRADLEAAVLAEREACAKVVQAYEAECAKFLSREGITVNAFDALAQAAFLIRARKP